MGIEGKENNLNYTSKNNCVGQAQVNSFNILSLVGVLTVITCGLFFTPKLNSIKFVQVSSVKIELHKNSPAYAALEDSFKVIDSVKKDKIKKINSIELYSGDQPTMLASTIQLNPIAINLNYQDRKEQWLREANVAYKPAYKKVFAQVYDQVFKPANLIRNLEMVTDQPSTELEKIDKEFGVGAFSESYYLQVIKNALDKNAIAQVLQNFDKHSNDEFGKFSAVKNQVENVLLSTDLTSSVISFMDGVKIFVGKKEEPKEVEQINLVKVDGHKKEEKYNLSENIINPALFKKIKLTGGIELTDGAVFPGQGYSILIKRVFDGYVHEYGKVNPLEAEFEINVKERYGLLMVEIFSHEGQLVGQGTAVLTENNIANTMTTNLNIKIKPIIDEVSGQVISFNSFYDVDYPVQNYQVTAHFEDDDSIELNANKEGFYFDNISTKADFILETRSVDNYVPTINMKLGNNSSIKPKLYTYDWLNTNLNKLNIDESDFKNALIGRAVTTEGNQNLVVKVNGIENQAVFYFKNRKLDLKRKSTSKDGFFALINLPEGYHIIEIYKDDVVIDKQFIKAELGRISLTTLGSTKTDEYINIKFANMLTNQLLLNQKNELAVFDSEEIIETTSGELVLKAHNFKDKKLVFYKTEFGTSLVSWINNYGDNTLYTIDENHIKNVIKNKKIHKLSIFLLRNPESFIFNEEKYNFTYIQKDGSESNQLNSETLAVVIFNDLSESFFRSLNETTKVESSVFIPYLKDETFIYQL